MAAMNPASRGINANFPRVLKTTFFACLCAVALAAAQPATPPAPSQSAADSAVGFKSVGTFRANEGMLIRIPLDTASVLNGAWPIDSSGYVTLPVAGRLYVHDLPAHQVEAFLGKRMSQYLRDTHVMATPVVRLTLIGHWQRPGMHFVDPELSVWDACRMVGGPAGEQNIEQWKVMRGSQVMGISLLDEFSRGTSLRASGVRSGDIFIIPQPNPQSGFWYWFRETLTVTAQVATILGTSLTAYLTYLAVEDRP